LQPTSCVLSILRILQRNRFPARTSKMQKHKQNTCTARMSLIYFCL